MEKLFALYKLTRVGTIMDSFVILMALALIAARISPDLTTLLAIGVNLLILVFAYMINDIADAEDDKHDPVKKKRNPVSARTLSYFEAYLATAIIVIISLLALLSFGRSVLAIGISMIVAGFLYSWKPVRLKSIPVLDILSHGYFLAASQVLFFALLPGATFDGLSVMMAVGVYVFSIGGDLYNEVRDWKVDQKAGINNTASILGYKLTRSINYLFWGAGAALVAATCVIILLPVLRSIV